MPPANPRFRLSYSKGKDDAITIKFEAAPPGKPDGFKTYLEGLPGVRLSATWVDPRTESGATAKKQAFPSLSARPPSES